jgi:undecaprenyl-diphosphatase
MVSSVETVIFGIIQGLTEWLPVSSSGHLAIAKEFFDWQPPIIFYVLLHIGTLVVIVAFFRRDIAEILKALVRRDFESEDGKLGIFVMLGSVPTTVIGYVFRDIFASFFDNLLIVGGALLATGVLLFVSKRRKNNKALSYLDSFFIGIAQGIAIIPGVSRSGATISTGLLRSVNKEVAFKFSFLLSIPAVLGAAVAQLGDLNLLVSNGDVAAVVVGVLVSMVVGYLSLKALQRIVMKQKFHLFAFYCWAAGILVVLSQIL